MSVDIIQRETPGMWAQRYAAQGWHVFPVKRGSKVPQIGGGKGFKDASCDPAQVQQWWNRWPKANIGIATGAVSGIVVLDVDLYHAEAEESLSRLEAQYGSEHARTLMARTGGGGLHLFFRHPRGGIKLKSRARLLPGLDTRADGGYVVAAPSVHESGAFYRWLNFGDEILPLPEWLRGLIEQAPAPPDVEPSPIRRFEPTSEDATFWLRKALDKVNSGEYREPTGFWLATMLRDAGIDEAQAQPVMIEYADSVPFTGHAYDPREALSSLRSAYRQPAREPAKSAEARARNAQRKAQQAEPPTARPQLRVVTSDEPDTPDEQIPGGFNLTDTGNAERLVARHGHNLRYCPPWKTWLVWDGAQWVTDEAGGVIRKAKETVRAIYHEAGEEEDDKRREQIAKHAKASESARAIKAMVELAQPELPVMPANLDCEPWLLNVKNGIVDLRSGELMAHDRAYLMTKCAPVEYDPNAKCPTFLAFLQRIMANRADLIEFLQMAIGYSLTGSTREQVFFILHGVGQNGKSTLLELIRDMLGEYASQMDTRTLMAKQNDNGANSDVARLKAARMVSAVETNEGKRLDEALVKQITGGDTITARFLYSKEFEFKPEFKIWLATNHKPNIRDTTDSIWRRIRLIPFEVRIPDDEQDKSLPDKLRAELPGIFAWAVQGCLKWQRCMGGLPIPSEVREATDAYRADQDVLEAFIGDCCILKPSARISLANLFKAWTEWCDESGERPGTQRQLNQRLAEKYGSKVAQIRLSDANRTRGWEGVGLLAGL